MKYFFWKQLVHNCSKRGVEVEIILEINKRGGWKCEWRVDFFFKISKRDFTFIREMRVHTT